MESFIFVLKLRESCDAGLKRKGHLSYDKEQKDKDHHISGKEESVFKYLTAGTLDIYTFSPFSLPCPLGEKKDEKNS